MYPYHILVDNVYGWRELVPILYGQRRLGVRLAAPSGSLLKPVVVMPAAAPLRRVVGLSRAVMLVPRVLVEAPAVLSARLLPPFHAHVFGIKCHDVDY